MADAEQNNDIAPVKANQLSQDDISSDECKKKPTVSTTAGSITSADIATPDCSDTSSTKRAAPVREEEEQEPTKKIRSSAAVSPVVEPASADEEVIDMAVKLGYHAGDRLEVEWDMSNDDDDEAVTTRWWSATLLPFDGRTHESVAIRTLEYEAYPQGGFHEKSREDVVFVNRDTLVDPDTQDTLTYRRVGQQHDQVYTLEEIEPIVDQILQGALAKNQAAWSKLPAAQQALIASKIAAKKEKLVQILQQQTGVITPQGMQAILAQTMTED